MKASKQDIVREVSKELGIEEVLVQDVMDAVLIEIVDNWCEGKVVVLQNFGTFTPATYLSSLHPESSKSFHRIKFKLSRNLRNILPKE